MITTITNQKGGVAKTTTSQALANSLRHKGYKTLLVDIDPQANLSYAMGADLNAESIYNVLRGECEAKEIVQTTKQGDIIISSINLAAADMEFTSTGREFLLKEALEPLTDDYDIIIIDTPPTLGILTINALTASDNVLIPVCAEIYSLQGMAELYKTITKVRKFCNSNLEIAGVLLTRYNPRTVLTQDIKESISKLVKGELFETQIREAVVVKEAQAEQKNLLDVSINSNPAQDYLQFTAEFVQRIGL